MARSTYTRKEGVITVATTNPACPCGSGKPFAACCQAYVERGETAPTAEALMRSRYTAYVLRHEAHLLATWDPATRPAALDLAAEPATKWLGLEVKQHRQTDAEHATVEFVARYKIHGRAHRLHEVSRFRREEGRWLYVAGEVS